jgi:hypothetical protein
VAVQDELGRRFVELIEHRQDRAAGIAEHHFHLVLLPTSISWRICAPVLPLYFGLSLTTTEDAGLVSAGRVAVAVSAFVMVKSQCRSNSVRND